MSRKVEETIESTSITENNEQSHSPASSDQQEHKDFHDGKRSPSSTPSPRRRSTPSSSTTALEDETAQEDQITSKLVFAFGPFQRHYFYSNVANSWQTSMWARPDGHANNNTFDLIGPTYAFAFSPHGEQIAAYKDSESEAVIWSFSPSVFGPGASCYAFAGGECIHHDLPKSLAEAIESRKADGLGYPDILTLNAGTSKEGTYPAGWAGGAANWSLTTETALYKLMEDGDYDELVDVYYDELMYVYLSPVRSQDFVALTQEGLVSWIIPGGMSEETFSEVFLGAHAEEYEGVGKTYKMEVTSGMEKHTLITPAMNHTFEIPERSAGKKALDPVQTSAAVAAEASSGWLS